LGGDQLAKAVHRAAVAERLRGIDTVDTREVEHLPCERQRQLHDVVGSATGEHVQGLGHLDGVADSPASG
jgi:hypothetical protein